MGEMHAFECICPGWLKGSLWNVLWNFIFAHMQKVELWYWAQGHCSADDFELVSYELFEAGVQTLEELDTEVPEGGVMPDHPMALALTKGVHFGPIATETRFRFYTDDFSFRNGIVEQFPLLNWNVGDEPAQDWDRHWRERQHPVHVSKRLWVRPPWVEFIAPEQDAIVLTLEAKSAFGTGEHESTSLTSELMERLEFTGKSVLDIGTGTGILSMFALKLGASRAVFTEIDPCAIPCLVENFSVNDCPQATGFLGGLECIQGDVNFDIILCNMIRSEVWPLRTDILRLLKEGGFFVLSGQLLVDKHYITDWFTECGLSIHDEIVKGEWWSVSGKKLG